MATNGHSTRTLQRKARLVGYSGLMEVLPYSYSTLRKMVSMRTLPFYGGNPPLFDIQEVLDHLGHHVPEPKDGTR